MELEPGFKLSEAGPIPNDWQVSRLGDACVRLFDGPHHTPAFVDNGIAFYAGENVVRSTFRHSNFISEKEYQELCRRAIPQQWDTLLVRVGDIGESAIAHWEHPYHVYVNLAVLRPGDNLDPKYLFAYTKYEGFRTNLFDRSLMHAVPKKINMGELANLKIAYPTRHEQCLIGSVLSDFDRVIEASAAEVEKLSEIMTAAMEHLLSSKNRFPDFAEEWRDVRLRDACHIHKGSQLNRSSLHPTRGYPVWNGGITPSGFAGEFNEIGPAVIISEGGNSCGFVSWVGTNFWCSGHCYRLKPISTEIDQAFLYFALKFREAEIQDLRVGSGLPNIQKERLSEFAIMLPRSLNEQRAIAAVLTGIDTALAKARLVVTKAKSVKAAAMDALLSGRMRLPLL